MASAQLYPLFTKGIDKMLWLEMRGWDPEWKNIFHIHDTNDRYIWMQGWQGYPLPQPRQYGDNVAQGVFQPDFSKQFIVSSWGLGDSIPEEDIDDDIYGVIHKMLAMKGGAMGKAFQLLYQYQLANFLAVQGYASGSTVWGTVDGLSLFNTAHPVNSNNGSPTFANRPSVEADLSNTSSQVGTTALETQKAPDNYEYLKNPVRRCIINPQLEYVAKQVFKGKWKQDSADLNENFQRDDRVEIVLWPYFTKSGATGTNNAWILQGEDHGLHLVNRQAASSKTDFDINTMSQIINTTVRMTYGSATNRGTYSSTGL